MVCKEIEALTRHARRQGWRVQKLRNGHIRWTSPDNRIIFGASTPGGGNRALPNLRATLRRAGLRI